MMRQSRLKDSTINNMIIESRRIHIVVVVSLFVLVISFFVLINPKSHDNLIMFAGSSAAIIASIAAIVLGALRVRGIGNQRPPPPPPPPRKPPPPPRKPPPPPRKPPPPPRNNASHEGRATGLENRQGNTVSLGYLRLHRRQWRALVEELKKHSEQNTIYWSRRKMENHNMPEIDGTDWEAFTGLTARNEHGDTQFKVLTQELQSLRIVSEDRKRVTNYGWRELCRVSGLRVTI